MTLQQFTNELIQVWKAVRPFGIFPQFWVEKPPWVVCLSSQLSKDGEAGKGRKKAPVHSYTFRLLTKPRDERSLLIGHLSISQKVRESVGSKKKIKMGGRSTPAGNTNMPSYWVRKHLSLLHQRVMCWHRYLAPQLRAEKSCHNVLWVSLASRCLSLKPQVFMVAAHARSDAHLNKRWERKIYQNSNVKRRKCVSLGWPPGWPSCSPNL